MEGVKLWQPDTPHPHLEPEIGALMPHNSELCFGFSQAWGEVGNRVHVVSSCISGFAVGDMIVNKK